MSTFLPLETSNQKRNTLNISSSTKNNCWKKWELYCVMAGQLQDDSTGVGPSFWVLFIVGLVIVLSLFRGFAAAVQNAGTQARAKRDRRRREANTNEHQEWKTSNWCTTLWKSWPFRTRLLQKLLYEHPLDSEPCPTCPISSLCFHP